MGLGAQIALLTWKNFLVLRRNICLLFCELIPTTLLILYVSAVVYYTYESISEVKHDGLSFKPLRITGNSLDFDREIQHANTINKYYNCNTANHTFKIAYSCEPNNNRSLVNELMQKLANRYAGQNTIRIEVESYPDLESMQKVLDQDFKENYNESIWKCGDYIGGVYFTNVSIRNYKAKETQLNYKIMLPEIENDWYLNLFWVEHADQNQIPSDPSYWQSAFLSLQFAIEFSFLDMNSNHSEISHQFDNTDFYMLRMPIDETSHKGSIVLLGSIPVIWILSILGIMLHTSKSIVIEKDAGIKVYMITMGMHPMAFYISHILIGAIKSTLVIGILTIIITFGIEYTSASIFVLISVLFGITMVSFASFISSFIRSAQLLQIFTIIGPFALTVLQSYLSPSIYRPSLCMLASLNPVMAYGLAVKLIKNSEIRMRYIGWTTLFDGISYQYTLGSAIIMLLVDSAILILLIFYLDSVIPTDDSMRRHPLFFLKACGISFFERNAKVDADEGDSTLINENMEADHGDEQEADIIIRNMSKKWWGGTLAVDNLNFRAYRGKLTVLLGQNGAGKTTTFSVLTGTIGPSSGQVLISGQNMETNFRDCQKMIGYCPQNNPLFDMLTVKEHLQLYAGLKSGRYNGPHGKKALEEEILQIVSDVNMIASIDKEAGKLSGGQKRKLCVAISLIGKSQVVLLDEPTAGMDPQARNEVGILLQSVKKDRTILLTTHYMEEADTLGDRIGIMANGRLICNGSPEFLKNKFGAGYILSLVCSDSFKDDESFGRLIALILSVIRKHSPNAYVDKAQRPPEFTIILPIADKKHYANLFEELENRKAELCISSLGLSLNNLEQVFLKVGELAEPMEMIDGDSKGTAHKIAEDFFSIRQQQFLHDNWYNTKQWFRQLFALQCRYLIWTLRNPFRSFMPIIITILCLIVLGLIGDINPSAQNNRQSHCLSFNAISDQNRIPAQFNGNNASKFDETFTKLSKTLLTGFIDRIDSDKDLHNELMLRMKESPPMIFGVATFDNKSTGRIQIEALFNGMARHSPPLALSFVTNALLGEGKLSIVPTIEIYSLPMDNSHAGDAGESLSDSTIKTIKTFILCFIIMNCFTTFFATMVLPLVEERSRKFKHQLMLTRLHVFTYWIAVTLWNLLFYIAFCSLLAIILYFNGSMKNCMCDLFILWISFFWCSFPMIGVASFIFDKPQSAFSMLLIYNFLTSIILFIIKYTLNFVRKKYIADIVEYCSFLVLPYYTFSFGFFRILVECYLQIPIGGILLGEGEEHGWYLQKYVWEMLLSGVFFWVLIGLIQSRFLATKFHQFSCQLFHRGLYKRIGSQDLDYENEDRDVREEREKLEKSTSREYALAVHHLSKYYGKLPAVKDVSFGVKHEECFGLLGVNGAGKTTTFDILTGVRFASSGRATVEGIDVNKGPSIGYCPQFDALPLEMTGREVLTLIARLNGFTNVQMRVKTILWCIRMEENADKRIEYCSGGQRRRISIGITLVTRSSLIMLDEPTAGIDPKTRRQIWELLQAIRQQQIAILLTSHSMDECEVLCNRIAFMNKGTLIGIGTSQQLKSRFGNSYSLSITVANPSKDVLEHLDAVIVKIFNANPTPDLANATTLHWEIPKQSDISWSWLFKKAQELSNTYPENAANLPDGSDRPKIVDFSLSQNSLEQVFLHMSNT